MCISHSDILISETGKCTSLYICTMRTYHFDDSVSLDVLALGSIVDGLHASLGVAVIARAGLDQL